MDLQSISQLLNDQVEVQTVIRGRSNHIHILRGASGKSYVVRTPKDDDAADLDRRGAVILRHIEASDPSLPVPHILHEAADFYVLSYLSGDTLKVWNHKVLSHARRHQLLRGLAGVLWKIWTCPVASPPIGKSLTYREWLLEEVDKGIIRSLNYEGWGDPIHFLSRRAKIDSLVPSDDDNTMAIKHGNLSAFNLLVADHGVSGVIDWDFAQVVPLPATVQHPAIIADIPGYVNDGVEEGMTFEEDRSFLEGEVRKLAAESTLPGAGRIPELLETSYQRRFLELSLRNRKVSAEWVRANEVISEEMLSKHVEDFIKLNPEAGNDDRIQNLRSVGER